MCNVKRSSPTKPGRFYEIIFRQAENAKQNWKKLDKTGHTEQTEKSEQQYRIN